MRIGAQVPGRIAEVLVALNDKVAAGDLLVRLDDEELIGRVHSAAAEAADAQARARQHRGDGQAWPRIAARPRTASPMPSASSCWPARRSIACSRRDAAAPANDADIDKARDAVTKAKDRLEQARVSLRKALSVDNLPAPTRPEAALVAARAELSVADAALERTRIRAPSAGTCCRSTPRSARPRRPRPRTCCSSSATCPRCRCRAEIEERDIGKVRVGQTAVVRSDAFPGKDFEGRIASLAQSLGPSRVGQRGPRKPTDVDVLEVLIDLAGQPPLLPGMRVDVFLRPEATAAPAIGLQQSATDDRPTGELAAAGAITDLGDGPYPSWTSCKVG